MLGNDERIENMLTGIERAGVLLRARNAPSRRMLRRRVAAGALVEVRDGLFARPEYWDGLSYREKIMHILRSVASAHPDWVLAQISAAAAWGLNETYLMHDLVHVAVDKSTKRRDSGYVTFDYIPDPQTVVLDGIRVTGLLQTVFDCARTLPFPQALAICDAAMRLYGVSRDDLDAFLDSRRGCKGVAAARTVIAHADPRSENGGESIVRGLLIGWGYEPPRLQEWIRDPVTGQWHRVDFLWILPDGTMIVLELDGREKYVNPDMLGDGDGIDAVLAEKEREGNLRLRGDTRFVRASYRQCEREPDKVRRKLDLAGVPRIT